MPTDQDCLGAIPVCQDTYSQQNSYAGTGNYPNEIPTGGGCPNNCMLSGELNCVWYIFTVQTSGNLAFVITPNNYADDYDWVVYSLNQYKCQDIITHSSEMQVSCNWSGNDGPTGATGGSSYNCQGAQGSTYNAVIPVSAGETFVLNISNYSSTQYGYLLDFTASTAEIYDDVAPELSDVETDDIQCGVDQLTFSFTENVKCSTVQFQDFGLDGPGGPYEIFALFGEACDIGGEMEKTYTITFSPAIFESGTYALDILPLSFISDVCGNAAFSQTLEFELDLQSPIADAGDDQDIPFLGTATLDGSVEGGSGHYSYSWEPAEKLVDPTIEDPTTIQLTETTLFTMTAIDNVSLCQSSDDVTVNIVGGEMSITLSADPDSVCAGNPTTLSVNPSGGSGDYSYTWTSDPPGFSSNIQTPTAYPQLSTIYYVEVTDGYSTINDDITIVVFENPTANAGPDQVINVGTPTTLDGSAGEGDPPYQYWWEPAGMIDGDNTITNPATVVLDSPQNYSLVVTDENSCPSEASVVLINTSGDGLSAFPQATPPEICVGESAVLKANATGGGGTYIYSWTSTETGWSAEGDNISITPGVTTTYYLEVDDGYNKYTSHIIVAVHPLPVIDLIPPDYVEIGQDTIVACVRDTILLDAGNESNPPGMDYLWSNNWAERYIVAKTNGNWYDVQTFSVIVKNSLTTCMSTEDITILFDFNQCEIGLEEKPDLTVPVTVHPNPNGGILYVNSEIPVNQLDITLLTIQGKPVVEKTYVNVSVGELENPIDISELPQGIYLLLVEADNTRYLLKVVKK